MTATSETKRIAVIPGDGIGKEVTPEGVKVLEAVCKAVGKHLAFTHFDWGTDRFLRDGTTLPPNAIEMLHRDFDAILFGAMGDPRVPSNQPAMEILLGLRFKLDLYVNARPCVLLDKRLTPLRDRAERDINFIILRENTEGAYAGIGGVFKQGMPDEIAIQEDLNTRKGVERIIRYAFEFARKKGLKRICMSDKSNAMQFGHGLWQRVWAELRKEYADIETRHLFVDTLMMEMVRDPAQFDVIVTCNMFGDIASDLGAQLSGGLGLAASGNIHPCRVSLFEPVHGSAPNIAGKGIANPLGSILTAAMMLEYLGWQRESEAMNAAVQSAVREGKTTPDLGGTMNTRAVGDWVAERIAKQDLAGAGA